MKVRVCGWECSLGGIAAWMGLQFGWDCSLDGIEAWMELQLGWDRSLDGNAAWMGLQLGWDCSLDGIAAWMGANRLKHNNEKTEVIWFSSLRKLKIARSYTVRFLRRNSIPSKALKNLRIYMYRDLTMSTQISKIIRSFFYLFLQIRSIKECLTTDSSKTLASALVLSRIDDADMALLSLPQAATQSIQSIINTAARLVTGGGKMLWCCSARKP